MTIQKLQSGVEGTPGNMTGADIATSVNGLIDIVTPANITRPKAIALCGDSITDDSHSGNQWTDWGWGSWFRRFLNKSYTLDREDIFATASEGTVHLLATQLPQVLGSGCGFCITMIGTNDIGSVDIVANLETFYDSLKENQITAIAMPIMPRQSFDAAASAQASIVNKYLYDRSKTDTNFYYFSTLRGITDFRTGDAASGILRDGIHTTKIGAEIVAQQVVEQFNSIFSGSDEFGYAIDGNTYDATNNPNGNIVANPYMTGTGGTTRNGATGDVANNWFLIDHHPAHHFP